MIHFGTSRFYKPWSGFDKVDIIKHFILASFSYLLSFCDFFSLEKSLALLVVVVGSHQWLFVVVAPVFFLLFAARVEKCLHQQIRLSP